MNVGETMYRLVLVGSYIGVPVSTGTLTTILCS